MLDRARVELGGVLDRARLGGLDRTRLELRAVWLMEQGRPG